MITELTIVKLIQVVDNKHINHMTINYNKIIITKALITHCIINHLIESVMLIDSIITTQGLVTS